ncbi:MAG: XrtA/PEP-CTERM system histidine kinase PrsK [Nitrospirota bacterium]|nr:XrtA/PEP-CTERM system histidine kinase PrsK [Nitrospirota bacterium]
MSILWLVPIFSSIFAALLLIGVILLKQQRGPLVKSLIIVIGATAWIQAANALGIVDSNRIVFWKQIAVFGEIIFPIALYRLGTIFIRDGQDQQSQQFNWQFRILLALGLLCASGILFPLIAPLRNFDFTNVSGFSKVFGNFVSFCILGSLVIALAQLEQVLRAARDPVRYKIKFVVIGLGGLAGFSILQASQIEIFSHWNSEYALVEGIITLLSIGLVAYGLGRWHLNDVSQTVYISSQALLTSFTFLFVGGYFIVVGGLGELLRQTDWPMGKAMGLLFVFIAVMALIVVGFSRQAKAELRLFLSRHFTRAKYDYRLKWIEVSNAFRSCDSTDSILDNTLDFLIRTFGAEHVTIWLNYDADGRFHQVRSANIEAPPPPLDVDHPLLAQLSNTSDLIDFSRSEVQESQSWKEFFASTHALLCAGLQTPDSIHGFITLSREFGNRPYSQDDRDLLTSIAHYVAIQLAQAKLSEERTAAEKWEAVSRFAAFYLHDLKTLIAGLSLVAQNAKIHGHDPGFQESAMRTVTNTVRKLTALINKISTQTKSLPIQDQERVQTVNINDIIMDSIRSITGGIGEPKLTVAQNLDSVSIVPEQFKHVIMNLIQNAQQSAGPSGEIHIVTEQADDTIQVTIADTGPGIPEAQLRTLFQPFKTTKTHGFGIGLYQCKAIVEQAHGRLRIHSQEGQGTQIHIALPVAQVAMTTA